MSARTRKTLSTTAGRKPGHLTRSQPRTSASPSGFLRARPTGLERKAHFPGTNPEPRAMKRGSMAAPLPSRGDIVRVLSDAGKPLHAREIGTRLTVAEGSYSRLLELLEQLSFDGTIRRLSGHRFR